MRDPMPVLVLVAAHLLLGAAAAGAQATDTATYQVRFQATWSASSHPQSFPPNPHFSGLIGGVHHAGAVIWQEGGIASPGIEQMAEIGAQSPLDTVTNVEVELTIEDTETGQVNIYANPLGHPFQPIQDTRAFSVCP